MLFDKLPSTGSGRMEQAGNKGENAVNGTVLVIEDNPLNMKLTRGLLGLLDCTILEAEDAETGLKILQKNEVDLVLLDIQLPRMDGMSACRLIRQEMDRHGLPVIALTAMAMKEDLDTALEAGFSDYITKPINTRDFLEQVSGWLSGERKGVSSLHAQAVAQRTHKKILVVDDSRINVKILKGMLPDDLYEIIEAFNGQQALTVAAASHPDVIFLDIMMPDIDGFEVMRRLKGDPETAQIPIVLVTALDGLESRLQGFELGAEDVLVKPVNRVEVLARAKSMVLIHEYRRQLSIREQTAGSFAIGHSGVDSSGTSGRQVKTGTARTRKKSSILVVEDNQQDADLFLTSFEKGDYDVEVAMDGAQALRHLEEKEFDLVLLDLFLPDMDGLEILDQIKETGSPNSPQVVIVTAITDIDTRLKGVEHGADDYLVKPIHPRELQARVQALLRKKGYIDSLRADYQSVRDSAVKDDLTGVYNKAYLTRYLELEIKRSQRQNYPITLVMADIDDFKSYSDRFGQFVGDLVIREVASVLKETFRDVDLVARYGKEEFAVVLPYCSESETEEIVNRVRRAVSTHPFPEEGDLAPGTVSISTGIATYPVQASSAGELLKAAGEMLFNHKQEKRSGAHFPGGDASP
jgi:two-component system cell cycle response regulator